MRVKFEIRWDKNGVDLPQNIGQYWYDKIEHVHGRVMALPELTPNRFRELEALVVMAVLNTLGLSGQYRATKVDYNPETGKWSQLCWTVREGDPVGQF